MWQAESELVDMTVGIRVTLWLPLIYCKNGPMPEEDEEKLRTRVLLRKNRFERECLEDPAFLFPKYKQGYFSIKMSTTGMASLALPFGRAN